MPVVTVDALVHGKSRAEVLEWLSVPKNHRDLLVAAFSDVRDSGEGAWTAALTMSGRKVDVTYRFEAVDEEHGGRRVRVALTGKRTQGRASWSLRTMKPSSDTLVTLHADYEAGGMLGALLDQLQTRAAFEKALRAMVDEAVRRVG